MLEALEKEGLLRRQQQGRQWYVLAPDSGDGKGDEPSVGHRRRRILIVRARRWRRACRDSLVNWCGVGAHTLYLSVLCFGV